MLFLPYAKEIARQLFAPESESPVLSSFAVGCWRPVSEMPNDPVNVAFVSLQSLRALSLGLSSQPSVSFFSMPGNDEDEIEARGWNSPEDLRFLER